MGAIVGFSILLTFISSFKYIKSEKKIFIFSLISLILVLFQAWIGSIVVSTKLMPGIITLHMIIALLIICLVIAINLIMIFSYSDKTDNMFSSSDKSHNIFSYSDNF